MAEKRSVKKLIIQPHRYGGETAVISLRHSKEMLAIIDRRPGKQAAPWPFLG